MVRISQKEVRNMKGKNEKRKIVSLVKRVVVAFAVIQLVLIGVLGTGKTVNAAKSASYWDAVFSMDIEDFYSLEWKAVVRNIKAGTKCHIHKKNAKDKLNSEYVYYKFELEDGTMGYMPDMFFTQNKQAVANASKTYMYVKSDTELKSKAGSGSRVKYVFGGTKVEKLKTSGKYTQVKTGGKTGWIATSSLNKSAPKTMYVTKTTTGHKSSSLSSSSKWLRVPLGNKVTVQEIEYKNASPFAYKVKTSWGDVCWVSAKNVSTVAPTTIYAKSDTKVYKSANTKSKKLATIKKGTKVTRISTKGSFWEVKYSNGKKGYVEKSKFSYKAVGKKVKSYGTYYLCENTTVRTPSNTGAYQIGRIQAGSVNLGAGYYTKYTKVTRMDQYYYKFNLSVKDRSKKRDDIEGFSFIKVQMPDGQVGFIPMSELGKSKADVDKKMKVTQYATEEKKALDYLNKVRKSKGLKPLKVNNELKKKYTKIWKKYGTTYGLDGLAHTDTLPNLTNLGATEGKDCFAELVLNGTAKPNGVALTKKMIGSGKDAHGRQMLSADYTEVAIIILRCNGDTYYAVELQG